MRNLKNDHQLQYQEEISIAHNTDVLPGKHKAKNPTIIYYVYIIHHETISYKTLIQELPVQYNRLTLSYKNQQIHVPILCLQTACLLCAIPANGKPTNEFKFLLLRLCVAHGHIHCVCDYMSALDSNHK